MCLDWQTSQFIKIVGKDDVCRSGAVTIFKVCLDWQTSRFIYIVCKDDVCRVAAEISTPLFFSVAQGIF